MTSSATVKEPLGATTTNGKWYLDVNTGTDVTPVWVGVFGITEFKPTVDSSTQDDSDFDSDGWGSDATTQRKWKNEGKAKRAAKAGSTPPVYDPGQEVLRLAGAAIGADNIVDCRWYEMEPEGPRVEAYRGKAAVGWVEDGGNASALSTATFTLNGRGKRDTITHPTAA
jgi:hypothetical protein